VRDSAVKSKQACVGTMGSDCKDSGKGH
jgi:hypothetical protein